MSMTPTEKRDLEYHENCKEAAHVLMLRGGFCGSTYGQGFSTTKAEWPHETLDIAACMRAMEQRLKDAESQLAAMQARAERAESEKEDAIDREAARWQEWIDTYVYAIDPNRDGSGVDSGDPADLTECELRGALDILANCMDELLASPQGVVPKSCERFYSNGHFDLTARSEAGREPQ
jgi:hypothetical protein